MSYSLDDFLQDHLHMSEEAFFAAIQQTPTDHRAQVRILDLAYRLLTVHHERLFLDNLHALFHNRGESLCAIVEIDDGQVTVSGDLPRGWTLTKTGATE